jgi:hypothetical protein
MRNLALFELQTDQTRFISCIQFQSRAYTSQLGRYEVKKAEQEWKNLEAMKKRQLELLQLKGFKAHL